MKKCLFILLYYCTFGQINAQTNNRLHYFINKKDSLVGVKDSKDNIIIPANYPNFRYDNLEKVPDNELLIVMEKGSGTRGKPAWSAGDAFDRNGNFLFHPLSYDNGPDYLSEGTIRCVENDKVGFVNREGKIIIKPKWDWASEFNYGYAFVCNGCYFDFSKDSEHPDLAFYPEHEAYYIDKNGIKTDSLHTPIDTILDYKSYGGGYYPYPFKYDAKEQKIVDSFNNKLVLKQIKKIAFRIYGIPGTSPIRFEIVNKPTLSFPYYELQGYSNQSNQNDLIFLVDKKGNWFNYARSYKKMNFRKWLRLKKYPF